jgi:hypothetical protein
LQITGLVTIDAVADVLPDGRVTDSGVASLTLKSVQDHLINSAGDGKVPPATESTKMAKDAWPTGGGTMVPPPK